MEWMITDWQKSQEMGNRATWTASGTLLRKLDINIAGEQAAG